MARYLHGLKPAIRDKIGCQLVLTLREAQNMARKAESMVFKGYYGTEGIREFPGETSTAAKKFNASSSAHDGLKDVVEKEPTKKTTNNPYTKPTGDKCYRCGQPGHRSNNCPQRRAVNMANYAEEREGFVEDDEGVCLPDGEEDDVPTFVVRKVLMTPKQEDTRHQLFRTRCTISGQVFEVVIDSGSCENIISRNLVNILKLPVEKHPEPYTIGWIKKGEGIQVTDRCRVPLSIGKYYKDEVICDVADMNICQLLFGRPWQYDFDANHSGRRNIYQFVKDGHKVTLMPLSDRRSSISRCSENMLTVAHSGYEFVSHSKQTREIHALVVAAQPDPLERKTVVDRLPSSRQVSIKTIKINRVRKRNKLYKRCFHYNINSIIL